MRRAVREGGRLLSLVALLVALAVVAAGCGSGSASKKVASRSTTTTTKPQTLAERYTTIVKGGNLELQQLSTKLNKANGNLVVIQKEFRAVSATYHQVATEVQALPFPATMSADVSAMTKALGALVDDSTLGAKSVTLSEFDDVFNKLAADQKAEVAANNTVNHDLGIASIS